MRRAGQGENRGDLLLFAACLAFSLGLKVLPPGPRDSTAAFLRRTVAAPLLQLQARAERARNALVQFDRIALTSDTTALAAMSARDLTNENARLRSLLGLGTRLRTGYIAAEALHGDAPGGELTLTLSAGGAAGVTHLAPVVSADGLVGQVNAVDRDYSTAITWANPAFAASAMSVDGSVSGIIKAHLGGSADDDQCSGLDLLCPERWLLELRNVGTAARLTPGTLIVTSGIGQVYPPGIPIGTIMEELKTDEVWVRTYLVRPLARPQDVGTVLILQPDRTAIGVKGVWQLSPPTDSTHSSTTPSSPGIAPQTPRPRTSPPAAAAQTRTAPEASGAATPRVSAPDTAQATTPAAPQAAPAPGDRP